MDLIRTQDRAFPPQYTDRRAAQVVAESPCCAAEFSTPFPVIDAEAVEHNLRVMARWCRLNGLELHPHIKSTMAPQLFLRQLASGATGLTVATPAQLRYAAESGVRSVQLANELVQPREAAWLARWLGLADDRRALVWVDSVESVEVVSAAAVEAGVVVDVLLEVGQLGGRCGVRTEDQRRTVAAATRRATGVRLVGVAGYEGAIAGRRDEAGLSAVRSYFRTLREMLQACVDDGSVEADTATVSAGGSMFTDLVVEAFAGTTPRVILRSGCYLLHDHGLYARNAAFGPDAVLAGAREQFLLPAVTVWASVVSRPEPQLALLDAGRRDVSFDQGLPVPVEVRCRDGRTGPLDGVVRAVNDQHAFVDLADGEDLQVGDRVRLGISHPCTTMDKWSKLPVVDPQGVLVDIVATWF
jgi:D-serine deaminase-like pyridoxal phosphate-dependent protein